MRLRTILKCKTSSFSSTIKLSLISTLSTRNCNNNSWRISKASNRTAAWRFRQLQVELIRRPSRSNLSFQAVHLTTARLPYCTERIQHTWMSSGELRILIIHPDSVIDRHQTRRLIKPPQIRPPLTLKRLPLPTTIYFRRTIPRGAPTRSWIPSTPPHYSNSIAWCWTKPTKRATTQHSECIINHPTGHIICNSREEIKCNLTLIYVQLRHGKTTKILVKGVKCKMLVYVHLFTCF